MDSQSSSRKIGHPSSENPNEAPVSHKFFSAGQDLRSTHIAGAVFSPHFLNTCIKIGLYMLEQNFPSLIGQLHKDWTLFIRTKYSLTFWTLASRMDLTNQERGLTLYEASRPANEPKHIYLLFFMEWTLNPHLVLLASREASDGVWPLSSYKIDAYQLWTFPCNFC